MPLEVLLVELEVTVVSDVVVDAVELVDVSSVVFVVVLEPDAVGVVIEELPSEAVDSLVVVVVVDVSDAVVGLGPAEIDAVLLMLVLVLVAPAALAVGGSEEVRAMLLVSVWSVVVVGATTGAPAGAPVMKTTAARTASTKPRVPAMMSDRNGNASPVAPVRVYYPPEAQPHTCVGGIHVEYIVRL